MSIKAFRFHLRTRPSLVAQLRRIEEFAGMGRIAQGSDFAHHAGLPATSCKTNGVPREVIENSIGRQTALLD